MHVHVCATESASLTFMTIAVAKEAQNRDRKQPENRG